MVLHGLQCDAKNFIAVHCTVLHCLWKCTPLNDIVAHVQSNFKLIGIALKYNVACYIPVQYGCEFWLSIDVAGDEWR